MSLNIRSNLLSVSIRYLQILKVPFTVNNFKKLLENSPNYPNLYSLSKAVSRLHIDSEAYQVTNEKIHELKPPFLAYIDTKYNGKDFVCSNI